MNRRLRTAPYKLKKDSCHKQSKSKLKKWPCRKNNEREAKIFTLQEKVHFNFN